MEFLKIKKEPLKKESLDNKINVISVQPTNNNNEKLEEFLNYIFDVKNKKKSISNVVIEKSFNVGKAIKTNKMVSLIQYTPEELKLISTELIEKQKPFLLNIELDEENENEKLIKTIKKKNAETKKLKKIEQGIAIDTFDEHDEIFDNFKYYNDDDKLFKINLNQTFILNNKIGFLNDLKTKMNGLDVLIDEDSCDKSQNTEYKPFIHQMIVKQYLNSFSPYRGLLLYHGLGSGKTCSSIGIIESMKYNKDNIFILTPASLQKNYKTQMKSCGNQLFKTNNYWEYVGFPSNSSKRKSFIYEAHQKTHLPIKYLEKRNGIFLIDKTKDGQSNFNELSRRDKEEIEHQINIMIDNKFKYINYNGITKDKWNIEYTKNKSINPFHNSTIIIDEGHNFVSRIVNKINIKKESVSTDMYHNIMMAENCNVVILSGTPLINYPCELGVLFNLIGGYNYSFEIKISHVDKQKISQKEFVKLLRQNKNIDLIEYFPYTNILRVTQNPYGFIKNKDGSVQYNQEFGNKTSSELKKDLIQLFKSNNYKVIEFKVMLYKKFPDNEQEFNKYFVGSQNNLTKKQYFQSKIVGMVSYLGDKKSLMPDVIVPKNKSTYEEDIFIEKIIMNDFVLKEYNKSRKFETEIDRRNKKKAALANKDTTTSSYRIFSRSSCNFVFPEDQQFFRPMPGSQLDKITEDQLDNLSNKEMLSHADGVYDESDVNEKTNAQIKYKKEIESAFQLFEEKAYNFFESDLPKYVKQTDEVLSSIQPAFKNNLQKYSPKMHKILENLLDDTNAGLHLLYSHFRNLGGIGIFVKILDYYGFTQFKIKQGQGKMGEKIWELDLEHPYYQKDQFLSQNRKFYALYTGKESNEEKEIIRNVFNGNFKEIPSLLREQIFNEFQDKMNVNGLEIDQSQLITNRFGQIIKLLIISASGAEGIDLKNVRFVHIMEPYWHPVRISQVIGRARRICSHTDLPDEFKNVKIFMYLLSYDQEQMKIKKDNFIELIKSDTNEKGKLITTDERLYEIMLKKKQLMEEFLTAIKESSIDCLVNYDDKSKCLSFPKTRDANKKAITDINYKNDKHNVMKTTQTKAKSNNIEINNNEMNDNN